MAQHTSKAKKQTRDVKEQDERFQAALKAEDAEEAAAKASAGKGAKAEAPKKKSIKKEIRYTVILDEKAAKMLEDEVQRQRWKQGRKGFSRSELIREAVLAYLSKS